MELSGAHGQPPRFSSGVHAWAIESPAEDPHSPFRMPSKLDLPPASGPCDLSDGLSPKLIL